MTTVPPGQPLGGLPRIDGINLNNRNLSAGRASGDGYLESLVGVERIVGSAFADHIVAGAGTTHVAGSYGDDAIDAPAATVDPGPTDGEFRDGPLVFVTADPADVGLLAIGTDADDHLVISVSGGIATVRSGNGAALTAGTGCAHAAETSVVECVLIAELRFIVGYGGAGADRIELEGSGFPRDLTTTLDGGDDSDVLTGHEGQDILFAGPTGNDSMEGYGGDDALLSESMDADTMSAGAGNDQLVANYPCGGHVFIGGDGIDVGGFARVGTHFDTAAERHRQRIHAQIGYRSHQPAFCAREEGTQLGFDIEILEGAGGNDELIGSDGNDTIWGWGGDDVIRGLGGNDTMEGHLGNDQIYGGAGQDRLRGGSGYDTLHAGDGERDFQIDCGGGGGTVASRDPVDPAGC
jgi:Ca2+-binding RTX toxin-like protein